MWWLRSQSNDLIVRTGDSRVAVDSQRLALAGGSAGDTLYLPPAPHCAVGKKRSSTLVSKMV